jgi:hypothetical protein
MHGLARCAVYYSIDFAGAATWGLLLRVRDRLARLTEEG